METNIETQNNTTYLSIKTEFDQIVAQNFGDICKALALHINSLNELKELNRQGIKTEELIATIRSGRNIYTVIKKLCQKFGISEATANLILNTSFSNLDKILDSDYLDQKILQQKESLRTAIMPLLS